MDKDRELVVTVSTRGGEIVKIGELKPSGARRDLTEQEFADLVAYVLTNRYLNGETIRLDGAVRLAPK